MKCKVDKDRMCGNGWRNSVFRLDGIVTEDPAKWHTVLAKGSFGAVGKHAESFRAEFN
jgi:hypothetical protein